MRRGGRARFKAHAWNACKLERVSGVRIPPSPPKSLRTLKGSLGVTPRRLFSLVSVPATLAHRYCTTGRQPMRCTKCEFENPASMVRSADHA